MAISKKFSFALKKSAAEAASQNDRQKWGKPRAPGQDGERANGRRSPSSLPGHVFGFDAAEGPPEKPKAHALLGITDGQLEVEGGEDHSSPRVIPCRSPLPVSDYRLQIITGKRSEGDASETVQAGAGDNAVVGEREEVPKWGLQEMKRGKKEPSDFVGLRRQKCVGNDDAQVKTEPSGKSNIVQLEGSSASNVKVKSPAQGRITDEEAAASLIAEAKGEKVSSYVVPLLSRNVALAEVRQKYREEVQRSQRRQQQAGEPDKVLLQRELDLLPDAPLPSSSAYEAMPVEEFGAAMLRGMGLKTIPESAPPPKRKGYTRAGLGSEQEIDRLRERLEQQRRHEDAARKEQKVYIPLKTSSGSQLSERNEGGR